MPQKVLHINRNMLFLIALLCLPVFMQAQTVVLNGGRKTSAGFAFDGSSIKDTSKTYIIRRSLDLCGKTIKLPTGTKLTFDGGMLCNGVILLQGGPIHITNTKDALIFRSLYFRNEEYEGYQKRSCTGICKDTWFKATDDDDMLNMACAFDGIVLTKREYYLKQHTPYTDDSYPIRYRLLSKSFSIKSSCLERSVIHTDGQISIIRQSFYGRNADLGLDLENISIQADGYTYTKSAFGKENKPNSCFFGGALNNFGHTFSLNIQNCSFKGVYQLMQWNCYNDGLIVNIDNSEFFCGSFGMEIYNGEDFRKLMMRAADSTFKSYDAYVFSFVAVDADVKFSNCEVDGIELYHKGLVTFENCNLQKYLTHSGKLIQGSVKIDSCILQQRDFACESLGFTLNGMKSVLITDSIVKLDTGVLKANLTSKNPVLLNIQRCPEVRINDVRLETDADYSTLASMRNKITMVWGDGSEKQVSKKTINKGSLKSFVQ